MPAAPHAGPAARRRRPRPPRLGQPAVAHVQRDLPRVPGPLRLCAALAPTALRHQPGLLGASAWYTRPQDLGPDAERAGRGHARGELRKEPATAGVSGPPRSTQAGGWQVRVTRLPVMTGEGALDSVVRCFARIDLNFKTTEREESQHKFYKLEN